jgi:hypothetical protein
MIPDHRPDPAYLVAILKNPLYAGISNSELVPMLIAEIRALRAELQDARLQHTRTLSKMVLNETCTKGGE